MAAAVRQVELFDRPVATRNLARVSDLPPHIQTAERAYLGAISDQCSSPSNIWPLH